MKKSLKVSAVSDGAQADTLGIKVGDIFVSYNGILLSTDLDLSNAMYNAKNKKIDNVEIVIFRDGSEIKLNATLEPLGITCKEEVIKSSGSSRSGINYKKDYGVTRGVCSLVSFLGWLLVIGGFIFAGIAVVGALQSRYGGFSLMAILPGLGTAVTGFMMIMGSQVTRATVDNADHTREILLVMNKD